MDFDLDDDQQALRELARDLFADRVDAAAPEGDRPGGLDRDLWRRLAAAEILALTLPESAGGAGLGPVEACVVLEQLGAANAAVPLWDALLTGLVLSSADGAAARTDLAPRLAAGDAVVLMALDEPGAVDTLRPATVARAGTGGFTLTGSKSALRFAGDATLLLTLAAVDGGGTGVFLVDPSAEGVRLVEETGTAGLPVHRVVLTGAAVPAERVLDAGDGDLAARLVRWATVALAAEQLGCTDHVVRLTASYVSQREQFGRPIGSFQAVGVRVADAYIDVEATRVAVWQAADRVGRSAPDEGATEVAKYWASEGAQRVLNTALFVHGGTGVLTDYPLHRYFLRSKERELALGSAARHLAALGAAIADGTVAPVG